MKKIGDVIVVAPDSPQSGMGHAITLDSTLYSKKMKIDLSGFGLMKYFYTNLFVINSADFEEINRSLEDITIYKYDLDSKEKSALLIISDVEDSEKVLKVMRSFNSNAFTIPEGVSQIPSEAYENANAKIKELTAKKTTK